MLVGAYYFWSGSSNPQPSATPSAKREQTPPKPSSVMTPTPTTPTPTSAVPTKPSTTPTSVTKEIMVTGNEFAFAPSTLTLKKGETVKITFKNTGQYPHNLTIAAWNAATDTVNPGQSTSVTVTPTATGTFSYTCTVGSHADKGMKGTITVQ